jgi:tetratricopeptide (TPR) repeat protein
MNLNRGTKSDLKISYKRQESNGIESKTQCYNTGNYYFSLKNYEQAIKCYNKSILKDSQFSFTYNNKGAALKKIGKYNEAIECFDKAIELDSKCSYAYNNKAMLDIFFIENNQTLNILF